MLDSMTTTDTASLAEEYRALTEGCALVDRSERGKLALTGSGAIEFLNGQVTNDVEALTPGTGCYAAFLTHKGKMLGDLRILAVAGAEGGPAAPAGRPVEGDEGTGQPCELLLDTERTALQALFDMIRRFKIGYDVELHKRTLERSLLSLIGPGTDEIAAKAFGADPTSGSGPGDLPEHQDSHVLVSLDQTPVRLIRTDVGIEALLDSAAVDTARDALERAGASSVSEAAAEILRVERGRPRYGIDLDESTIPQEAGLNERAVSFTKGCYVGQETVARLYYKGKPNRHLRGLRLSEPVEPGAELLADRRSRRSTIGGERDVGRLTSSVVSPTFGPIGLALVRREAEPGMTVAVGEHGASAVVSELPFR
jgi:folate-binding protein YgfZ